MRLKPTTAVAPKLSNVFLHFGNSSSIWFPELKVQSKHFKKKRQKEFSSPELVFRPGETGRWFDDE